MFTTYPIYNPQSLITPVSPTTKFFFHELTTPRIASSISYPALPSSSIHPTALATLWSKISPRFVEAFNLIAPLLLPIFFIASLVYIFTHSDPFFAFISDESYQIPDIHSLHREFSFTPPQSSYHSSQPPEPLPNTLFNKKQGNISNNNFAIQDESKEDKPRNQQPGSIKLPSTNKVLPLDEADADINGENYFPTDVSSTYPVDPSDPLDTIPTQSNFIKHVLDKIGLTLGQYCDSIFSAQQSLTIKQATIFFLMFGALLTLSVLAASLVLITIHHWRDMLQFASIFLGAYVCINVLGYSVDTRIIENDSST